MPARLVRGTSSRVGGPTMTLHGELAQAPPPVSGGREGEWKEVSLELAGGQIVMDFGDWVQRFRGSGVQVCVQE